MRLVADDRPTLVRVIMAQAKFQDVNVILTAMTFILFPKHEGDKVMEATLLQVVVYIRVRELTIFLFCAAESKFVFLRGIKFSIALQPAKTALVRDFWIMPVKEMPDDV